MLNNCRYLLDVNDNQIAVNDHTILERDNPVRSELTFQFLNPDRVNSFAFTNPHMLTAENILKKLQNREQVTDTSYIRFFFPYGTEEGDFIDAERGKLINFETESGDWSVAQGVVEDRHISFVISCYNQKVIQTLFSVYFKCKNIQSYAPIGLTYVYADIKNVVGIDDVIKVFPIQKKLALPQINSFFSDKTTIGGNEKIRLQWQISGANEGQLTPGEINIFTLPAPGIDVELTRNVEYRLTLKGNELEKAATINLYVSPPSIAYLDYDALTRQVKWAVQYSEARQLAIGTNPVSVEANGELVIQMPEKPQIVLRAQGRIYSQFAALNLQGFTLSKPQIFRSWTRVYEHYTHTRWEWKTTDIAKVSFQFSENGSEWYTASTASSAVFEYVSEKPLHGARLTGSNSDGSEYCVLALDREVW